jgi:hypothetical protein
MIYGSGKHVLYDGRKKIHERHELGHSLQEKVKIGQIDGFDD